MYYITFYIVIVYYIFYTHYVIVLGKQYETNIGLLSCKYHAIFGLSTNQHLFYYDLHHLQQYILLATKPIHMHECFGFTLLTGIWAQYIYTGVRIILCSPTITKIHIDKFPPSADHFNVLYVYFIVKLMNYYCKKCNAITTR